MMEKAPNEDARYRVYRAGAYAAWWSAFAWAAALTYVNLTRDVTEAPNHFQRISGLGIILLMGIAISLGSALSRMRLAKTILAVFEVGQRVAEIRVRAQVDENGLRIEALEEKERERIK